MPKYRNLQERLDLGFCDDDDGGGDVGDVGDGDVGDVGDGGVGVDDDLVTVDPGPGLWTVEERELTNCHPRSGRGYSQVSVLS